ncbi:hypothetical protein HYQ46_000109 [Verticillium longisporum]|nr:hypothetical protein HYQ46_000109 [Verticillium longisporum]
MPPPRFIAVDEVGRVETPSKLDYRQLGAMKHGSLRITNGAASPVPSVDGDLPHDKAFGRAPECEIPMVGQTPKQTLAPITTTFINRKAVSSVSQSTFVGYQEPGDTSGHCLSPEYAPYEVLDWSGKILHKASCEPIAGSSSHLYQRGLQTFSDL